MNGTTNLTVSPTATVTMIKGCITAVRPWSITSTGQAVRKNADWKIAVNENALRM